MQKPWRSQNITKEMSAAFRWLWLWLVHGDLLLLMSSFDVIILLLFLLNVVCNSKNIFVLFIEKIFCWNYKRRSLFHQKQICFIRLFLICAMTKMMQGLVIVRWIFDRWWWRPGEGGKGSFWRGDSRVVWISPDNGKWSHVCVQGFWRCR